LTSLLLIAVLLVLTVVAVAGAARPYRRSAVPPLEPLSDPLEDRRLSLLISLRDLDVARSEGAIGEQDYVRLRTETEGRMARVLRAIDVRERGPASPNGHVARRDRTRVIVVAVVLVAALAAGVSPSLVRSIHQQASAESTPLADTGSIAFFRQRVGAHPDDVAARLDLAHRYLDAGLYRQASRQYAVALALDPRDVEALANLGILMHLSGRPAEGLRLERQALSIDPSYPEALFYEGVILLQGLHHPAEAVAPLRGYLKGSPFGSEGGQARRLLAQARREAAAP
jgi:cytochrome c-type biogenesis protein CcmH/NrfG